MQPDKRLILASKSPRRKQILEWADIDFEIIAIDTDESFPAELSTAEAPQYIARNKALTVKEQVKDRTILAADTVVILNGQLIGKPASVKEAVNTLQGLSGTTHQVITGVCILSSQKEISFSDTTEVEFHSLDENQIRYYVDRYKPFDKAGAYAIQEWIGVHGIKSIRGDFYNVMGLPVSRVIQQLRENSLL